MASVVSNLIHSYPNPRRKTGSHDGQFSDDVQSIFWIPDSVLSVLQVLIVGVHGKHSVNLSGECNILERQPLALLCVQLLKSNRQIQRFVLLDRRTFELGCHLKGFGRLPS